MKYYITTTAPNSTITETFEFETNVHPDYPWNDWIIKSKVKDFLDEKVNYNYRILEIDFDLGETVAIEHAA
jgi:hypothetical protein